MTAFCDTAHGFADALCALEARVGFLESLGGGNPPDTLSPEETAFWRDRAAALDPNAYEFVSGTSWSRTVPAGETWYALNLWHVKAGGPGLHLFQRYADARRMLLLPEGTVLQNDGSAAAFAYLCQPARVTADPRYADPKALYYQRLDRLCGLPLYSLAATATGSSQVAPAFPTDFAAGLVTLASAHDVGWTILNNPATGQGMNLLDEVSDTTRSRFAQTVCVPFLRATFPSLRIAGVSLPEGVGGVYYHKLPVDW